jgi:UDP-hydrolysing UDP-N-acetyl-D-glucosamine 2-epimerase
LFEIKKEPELETCLIAAGSHFSDQFGRSIDEIYDDGFEIYAALDCISGSSEAEDIVQDMSRSFSDFGKALGAAKPDVLVILGDRFETLTAASAALVMSIPIAHINGGEVTEGAFDDSIRHAITKMSSIHFVANSDYEKRVLQMGEDPSRVQNVGHLGLDSFRALDQMSETDLEDMIGIKLAPQRFLVTVHPETASSFSPQHIVDPILGALDKFPDVSIVFTAPNPDPGHESISRAIKEFVQSHKNSVYVESLGHRGYLSMMLASTIVIGNSSSGVLEAPIAGVPSIDVGERQKGRVSTSSIHKSPAAQDSIYSLIIGILNGQALGSLPEPSPVEALTVGRKITQSILNQLKTPGLNKKVFFDL